MTYNKIPSGYLLARKNSILLAGYLKKIDLGSVLLRCAIISFDLNWKFAALVEIFSNIKTVQVQLPLIPTQYSNLDFIAFQFHINNSHGLLENVFSKAYLILTVGE